VKPDATARQPLTADATRRQDARVSTSRAAARTAIAGAVVLAALQFSTRQPDAAPSTAFELPAPTGRYAVGTTSWRLVDRTRPETFGAPGEFRNVEVLAWYPAAPVSPPAARAPYLREGLAEVRTYTTLLRVPETSFDALADVRTHAELEAAPASEPRRFPVLVFSVGYTGIASYATAVLEDLASHGYVVLNVVHPYEVAGATLTDGRVVSLLDDTGAPRQAIMDVFAEWGPEDSTVSAVTSTTSEDEQLRLLRGYLGTLNKTGAALRRWVDDTRLVLDRLASLPATTRGGQLAARADLGRLGVFGHSMGGVVAGQFCIEDRRCRAGLNLDGIPQYGTMIDATMPRPFLMVYSGRPGRLGASDVIYRRAAKAYYRVDVRDTRHLDFCDMTLWGGPLRERPILGTLAPERVTEITRTVVRQYFDQELLGRRSPLLAGTQTLPEVAVRKGPR
jgi:dienelactone hydrolase